MAAGNGYIQYSLHLIAAQDELASVYADPAHPEEFFTGYVECVGARYFLMADVTPWGHIEGWRVLKTSAAQQILLGDEYEQRLALLMMHYGETHKPFFAQPPREEDVLYAVLRQCQQERRVVSLMVGEDMITGRVSEVNELRLKLDAMSFFGADAGVEQLKLREIDMVCIGTQEEQMYETLERMMDSAQLRILRRDGSPNGDPENT